MGLLVFGVFQIILMIALLIYVFRRYLKKNIVENQITNDLR